MNKPVNIKSLEIDTTMRIHPVLLWDDNDATLVDTGFPGQFAQLKQSIEQLGVPFNHLRRIFITHQDWDHIGAVPDIVDACHGKVDIYAHVHEKPYLEGTLPYIKVTPERIQARLQSMPAELRAHAAAMYARVPTFTVSRPLEDGELLPFYGGIRIIHTPGHTPGHICLFAAERRTLIAGDQLRVENGTLVGPAQEHTPDMPAALSSLKKLLDYDIDQVICYHGGTYGPNASARIAVLAGI